MDKSFDKTISKLCITYHFEHLFTKNNAFKSVLYWLLNLFVQFVSFGSVFIKNMLTNSKSIHFKLLQHDIIKYVLF